MPDIERPYRAWGYPIVPALFLIVTAWLLINTLWATPRAAITGCLDALGLPVLLVLGAPQPRGIQGDARRRRRRTNAEF